MAALADFALSLVKIRILVGGLVLVVALFAGALSGLLGDGWAVFVAAVAVVLLALGATAALTLRR